MFTHISPLNGTQHLNYNGPVYKRQYVMSITSHNDRYLMRFISEFQVLRSMYTFSAKMIERAKNICLNNSKIKKICNSYQFSVISLVF